VALKLSSVLLDIDDTRARADKSPTDQIGGVDKDTAMLSALPISNEADEEASQTRARAAFSGGAAPKVR
jgi:hypothetical protein